MGMDGKKSRVVGLCRYSERPELPCCRVEPKGKDAFAGLARISGGPNIDQELTLNRAVFGRKEATDRKYRGNRQECNARNSLHYLAFRRWVSIGNWDKG